MMNLKSKYYIHHQMILFIGCLSLLLVCAYDTFDDFPGPYCKRRGCCNNRQDNCSLPITTTLCYCDQFCDRSTGGDCCPDYMTYCRNAPPTIITCYYNGTYIKIYDHIKDNCNKCTCQANGVVICDNDKCIQDDAIISNINSISHTLGWTAKNYSEFWGHKYEEGLTRRLGTIEPTYRSKAMTRLTTGPHSIPREFNALNHWPHLISEVQDQGWCGSSWVLSTTSVASDRFAIQSKGKEVVQLAPQHILSCARRQRGCDGGHIDAAWRFLNKRGVVDENCYPYERKIGRCRITRTHSLSVAGCSLPTKVDRDYFYSTGPAYSINNETDIMHEIQLSGPVQATMRVYRDFFSYSGGVYRHSAASRNDAYGFHSVKLIGWGEEHQGYGKVVKYWIAANTWGTWWGENGYFRILRGQNECLIEDYVLAAWPNVHTPYTPYGKKSKYSSI